LQGAVGVFVFAGKILSGGESWQQARKEERAAAGVNPVVGAGTRTLAAVQRAVRVAARAVDADKALGARDKRAE